MKPPAMDRQTFLDNLRQSGLIGPRELQAAVQTLPSSERGKDAARELVRAGLLTRFQAELLLAGRTRGFLLGQYKILDQLGKGGMGHVYKAVHRTMKRIVALKVLAPDLVKTEKARQLFKHEVRAAARLLHPNIVTAYDANKVGGRYFLVMEHVNGLTLDQLVRRRGPLPVGLACEIIRQTAVGLQYAAGMGMIHRDIKPSNIMVTRGSPGATPALQVKILDFGLARLQEIGDSALAGAGTIPTTPNTVLGTPDYLSPEQARDMHAVDIRSDLYSLGCTFYYILTGKVPFPGGSSVDKLVRQVNEEPVAVDVQRPKIPSAVAGIVRRLMAKEPSARFQTPAELAEALAPFCNVEPASGTALTRVLERQPATPAGPSADSSAIDLGAEPPPADVIASSTWPADLGLTPLSSNPMTAVSPTATRGRPFRKTRLWVWLAAAAILAAAGTVALVLALQ
jgi:serine/threonine protein kinase